MICGFNTCVALSVLKIRYLKKCKLKILSLVLNMFNDKKSRYWPEIMEQVLFMG